MFRTLITLCVFLMLCTLPQLAAANQCLTPEHQECYDRHDECYYGCDYYTPGDCERCFTELDQCLEATGDGDIDCIDIATDNCPDVPNTSQADCDADGIGDACDDLNGLYQKTGESDPCYIDVDDHVFYWTLELYHDAYYTDTSGCNSPDRTILELVDSATCSKLGVPNTWECCELHYLGLLGAGACDSLLNTNHCSGEAF